MSEWVLDEDALNAAHERALIESRRLLRVKMDEILDELGIADPKRREQFHGRALQLAMPIGRAIIAEDIDEIRRRGGPATRH